MKLKICLLTILNICLHLSSFAINRDECRQMALDHSQALMRSENAYSNAELDCKIARTSYLPKIEGSATTVYMLPDMDMMGMKMQMHGAYMAGLQLTQPIYAGGKITAGNKLARIGKDVARQQLRMTRDDIIVNADNSYWTYVSVCSKLEMVEQFVAMIDTLLQQTSEAVDAGMATESDLLRIKAKQSEMEYQLQKTRNGAELCRMALCNTIGLDIDSEIRVSDSIPTPLVGDLNMAADISQRPELKLLDLGIEAKRQQVRMTLGDFLPTVGLSLGYNYYGNFKLKGYTPDTYQPYTQEYKDGIGMGLLSISIPLFHWGEGMMKVRKARKEVRNAQLEQEENARLMTLEARQAAMNVEDGVRMISAAEAALNQAEESLRIEQNRYDESMGTLTELLDSQTQWYQARSNLIEARAQYQINLTAYHRATGTL